MDPNPENFVGAGIIQTKALQVGCLLRLEPNAQAQVSGGFQGLLLFVQSLPFCLPLSFPPCFLSLYPLYPVTFFTFHPFPLLYHLSDPLILSHHLSALCLTLLPRLSILSASSLSRPVPTRCTG